MLGAILVAQVEMVSDKLSDLELATLNNVAQLDQDPRNRLFDYETVKDLFTQANGTKMHELAKIALAAIVKKRLID